MIAGVFILPLGTIVGLIALWLFACWCEGDDKPVKKSLTR